MAASMSDSSDFMQAMDGVAPIRQKARVQEAGASSRVDTQARREAATGGLLSDKDEEFVELMDPLDELGFKRPGIQSGVYRNLRLGKYPYEARLEIMGMPIREARREIKQFINDCYRMEIRSIAIAFGRSQHKESHAVWLKSYVNKWLKAREEVQAFHSAQRQHGGLGTVYVLLRKTERQRMETLERHQRRMG
ncbi:DNA endonuclease SmrA [Pokkaliibacter sp. CJK22405]|uniref:DNA endonuclease SmrA n=1 Tax=Pokkaliibacter sp. CJK22405 TaxID=3384615 RepID=UPI0039854D92